MIHSLSMQLQRLHIGTVLGAVTLTFAIALGNVGDARAHEPVRGDGPADTTIHGPEAPSTGATEPAATGTSEPGDATNESPATAAIAGQETELGQRVFAAGVAGNVEVHAAAEDVPVAPIEPEPTVNPSVEEPPAATPVAPTPEPTAVPPAPTPTVSASAGNCPIIIYNALGLAGCKISFCESGWNQNAVGTSGELGWFQVSPRWHPDATTDPAGNVAAAVRISQGGTDWSAWSVRAVLSTGHCPNGVPYPG